MDRDVMINTMRRGLMEGYWEEYAVNECLHILEAIKDCEMMAKLQGHKGVIDGATLVKKAWPNHRGWPADRLDCERKWIRAMDNAGIIVAGRRHQPPYGYGDDELFALTCHVRDLIIEKQYGEIYLLLREAIQDVTV
jgi:hypothetical protein